MHEHIQASGHSACTCSGYHFPHRPGSPCCEANRMSTYHRAVRAGASHLELMDLLLEYALDGVYLPSKGGVDDPPF